LLLLLPINTLKCQAKYSVPTKLSLWESSALANTQFPSDRLHRRNHLCARRRNRQGHGRFCRVPGAGPARGRPQSIAPAMLAAETWRIHRRRRGLPYVAEDENDWASRPTQNSGTVLSFTASRRDQPQIACRLDRYFNALVRIARRNIANKRLHPGRTGRQLDLMVLIWRGGLAGPVDQLVVR